MGRSATKAVILAGGRGTRLRPYSMFIPKPLVPIGDRPILEILLGQLKRIGIRDVVLCVNHLAEIIMSYLGDGSRYGVSIQYSLEDRPLNTVGPLKLVESLPDDFLVMNGDVLTDLDFANFFDYHLANGALLTVAAYRREVDIDFGVIQTNGKSNVATGFREKPRDSFLVSMGVYGFKRRVLEMVPAGEPYGFDSLMRDLLRRQERVQIYPYTGYWLDIGRPDDYEKANQDITSLDL